MKLFIECEKIEDRIKEQKLAEKRGWCGGCYGFKEGKYFVSYSKFKKRKDKRK
jgi:Leu/Phe-tRNA-protein transferase